MDDARPNLPAPANRVPWATGVFSVLLVALFVYEVARFGWTPTALELHVVGGLSRDALEVGQWWTPLTMSLLHISVLHLLLNVLVITMMGWFAERAWGSGFVALVIVLSALGAAVGADLVDPHLVTVGASGVGYGLIGFGLVQRGAGGERSLRLRIAAVIFLGIDVAGIVNAPQADPTFHVSYAGHVGGAIVGVIVGFLTWAPNASTLRRAANRLGPLAAVTALALAAAGIAPLLDDTDPATWTGPGTEFSGYPPASMVAHAMEGTRFEEFGLVSDATCSGRQDDEIVTCRITANDHPARTSVIRPEGQVDDLVLIPEPGTGSASEVFVDSTTDTEDDPTELSSPHCTDTEDEDEDEFRCHGRGDGGAVVYGTVDFHDHDLPDRTLDRALTAFVTAERIGTEVEDGTVHFERASCKGIDEQVAVLPCTGEWLGYGFPIDVDTTGDRSDQPVEIVRSRNRLRPMTGSQLVAALRPAEFLYPPGTPGSSHVTGGTCTPDGAIPYEDWTCTLRFDDGRSEELTVNIDADGYLVTLPVGEKTDHSHESYGPIVEPQLLAPSRIARLRLHPAATSVAAQLRGRTFTDAMDLGVPARVTDADCERPTPSDDAFAATFRCSIELDSNSAGQFAVDVMPGNRIYARGLGEEPSDHVWYLAPPAA